MSGTAGGRAGGGARGLRVPGLGCQRRGDCGHGSAALRGQTGVSGGGRAAALAHASARRVRREAPGADQWVAVLPDAPPRPLRVRRPPALHSGAGTFRPLQSRAACLPLPPRAGGSALSLAALMWLEVSLRLTE